MSNYKDSIQDWYAIANKNKKDDGVKPKKDFKNHLIKPCAMIMMVAPSGGGKSSSLIEFLSRTPDRWFQIVIFSGFSTDEDLYNFLADKIDGIQLIHDVEQLPNVNDDDSDRKQEKLIIFDDFINMSKKHKTIIQAWFNSARKKSWTCIAMVQRYVDAPIQMRENAMYWFIFRSRNNNAIKYILKNHNTTGYNYEQLHRAYLTATDKPKDFLLLDLLPDSPAPLRHNFLDKIDIPN